MPFPTVDVDDTVTRIREAADLETADEAKSIVTDAEIIKYVNDGYRRLYDVIAEHAPADYFGKAASVSAPYALPADFYRALGVDYGGQSLRQFTVMQRNIAYSAGRPRWRIQSGSLVFNPSSFSADVDLLYIPVASELAAGGSFNSFDGWDVYVVAYGVLKVRQKQEYDTREARQDLAEAEMRVRRAAQLIRPEHGTILDMTTLPDEFYYG